MAYIAVNTEATFVRLDIKDYSLGANANAAFAPGANSILSVPSLQDITVNATPGLFRWQELGFLSEKVVTTPSTNSINTTLVLDDTAFFTGNASTAGIFDLTNEKTKVYFRLYWAGSDSGDRYIQGEGYLSALAPTVSPTAPVWTTPVTIEVEGNYQTGNV
jgi:hypothetical protein